MMCNPFTTNYTRRETVKWLVALLVTMLFITIAVLSVLDFYIEPLLNGWELVIDYIMIGDNSFFNQTVQSEVDSFVVRSQGELLSTNWKNMTDGEIRDKLSLMIDNGTSDIFDKLYSIILVMVAPILTIPLVIWLVIKITIKVNNKVLSWTKLYDDEKEFLLYFRGRQIMGKPTSPNSNIL